IEYSASVPARLAPRRSTVPVRRIIIRASSRLASGNGRERLAAPGANTAAWRYVVVMVRSRDPTSRFPEDYMLIDTETEVENGNGTGTLVPPHVFSSDVPAPAVRTEPAPRLEPSPIAPIPAAPIAPQRLV